VTGEPAAGPGPAHTGPAHTGPAHRGPERDGRLVTSLVALYPKPTGPFGLVRHPGYAGGLLICAGTGLMSANWAGLAAIVLLPLAVIAWRIRMEERALLACLADRYRRYAAQHKRLIPLVW
jgi:hypothetical protein